MIKVSVKQVKLSDGSLLDLPPRGITIIVGPNNAGKSTFLRDLDAIAQSGIGSHNESSFKVVKDIQLDKTGSESDLEAWITEHADRMPQRLDEAHYGRVNTNGQQLSMGTIKALWIRENRLESLWRFFAHWMDANTRLTNTSGQQYDPQSQTPNLPIHKFYKNKNLREKLSKKAKDVFDEPLHLQVAGPQLKLLLGTPAHGLTEDGYPTEAYLEDIKALPLLDEQGSGMRSFMYMMINLMAQSYFCVLLDEPEAFLHPPQARALGSSLVTEVAAETQVIISTHSSDILRGVLNHATSSVPVKIVRLTRSTNENHYKELSHDDITKLWTDPVLKYSNVLDGLFHEAVVICESDSDCKYYSAIHDQLDKASVRFSSDNTLYTYAGSKQRVATMLSALRAVGVATRAAVDIDILNNEDDIKKLVVAAGGDWDALRPDWNVVNSHVQSLSKSIGTPAALKSIIESKISDIVDAPTLKQFGVEVKELVTEQTGWSQVKRGGKVMIPAGDATAAFSRLDTTLRSLGIHPVPVGELENFVKSIPGHGPKWVEGVFSARLHEDTSNHEALNYVSNLIKR